MRGRGLGTSSTFLVLWLRGRRGFRCWFWRSRPFALRRFWRRLRLWLAQWLRLARGFWLLLAHWLRLSRRLRFRLAVDRRSVRWLDWAHPRLGLRWLW